MVNSFKHRKGFKDYRKDGCSTLGAKFEVSRKEAFQSIDSVERFFKELWSNTGQTHMHNKRAQEGRGKKPPRPLSFTLARLSQFDSRNCYFGVYLLVTIDVKG